MFSIDELDEALPAKMKGGITPSLANTLNSVVTDVEIAKNFRDNFVNYTSVLTQGKFKLEDYMNAVLYVSFKLMGYTDKECYQRTFPSKYTALVARGVSSKDIAAYVSAYNRNKLVNLIFEQTLIPTWVLNQDVYQQAINTQLDLMLNAESEKVKTEAANSILNHLKRPENTKVEINMGQQETQEVDDLKQMMRTLAENQKELIRQGHSTKSIAHQDLIDVTPEEEQ